MPATVSHIGCCFSHVEWSFIGRRLDTLTMTTPAMLRATPAMWRRVRRRLSSATDSIAVKTMHEPETIWLMEAAGDENNTLPK